MNDKLSVACQIYLALELDKVPIIRQLAATVVTRYIMEFHRYGVYTDKSEWKDFYKIRSRFKLNDYVEALKVHYPPKYI